MLNQTPNDNLAVSLYDYLQTAKSVIDTSLDRELWIYAEVRAIHQKNGHHYLELAQKDEQGQIIASCRATIWRYRSGILTNFYHATGQTLKAGLQVLIQVSASFHTQYGFSINIHKIDANHTLGAIHQAYHQLYCRLQDEGLLDLNKSLPLPLDITDVVVISPQNAAGLGDFRTEADRLQNHQACQFYYHHTTFQGNHAPKELRTVISHAMSDFVQTHQKLPDLLVIIRGGGQVGDLAYLNDYELAALLAEQPVPVWVGIGHQRDRVILDEVAHTHFDTPSKVIVAIENHLRHTMMCAKTAMQKILQTTKQQIFSQKIQMDNHIHTLKLNSLKHIAIAKQHRDTCWHSFSGQVKQCMYHHQTIIDEKLRLTKNLSSLKLKHARLYSHQYLMTHKLAQPKLRYLANDCCHLQNQILMQHPKHTLNKGYALVYHHQKPIHHATMLNKGDKISIEFGDGKIYACVI